MRVTEVISHQNRGWLYTAIEDHRGSEFDDPIVDLIAQLCASRRSAIHISISEGARREVHVIQIVISCSAVLYAQRRQRDRDYIARWML